MKFLSYFVVTFIFTFLLWTTLVIGQFNNPTMMSQWIYDAYEKKQKISKNIKERKIVILAGSNALFGINSKMIEKAFKMPVLNYAVNAGIELPYTLHVAKKVIKENDIVIVPLEYPMYSYDGTAGVQMIDYIFSREGNFFGELSLYEQLYMLWHVDVQRVYRGYFYKGGEPIKRGLYGAHHIDKYGDQINTSLKYKNKHMFNAVERHDKNPEKYGNEFDKNALGWDYLEEFMKWCKKRDVKVVFMPTTLMYHSSYKSNEKESWFYKNISKIVKNRGWEYVGNPYDYMYDKNSYFDTNFHLIEAVRDKRTLKMIEDLKHHSLLENGL